MFVPYRPRNSRNHFVPRTTGTIGLQGHYASFCIVRRPRRMKKKTGPILRSILSRQRLRPGSPSENKQVRLDRNTRRQRCKIPRDACRGSLVCYTRCLTARGADVFAPREIKSETLSTREFFARTSTRRK